MSKLVNTDTERAIESVPINRASVLRGSCYKSKKKHLLLEQNTTEIERDGSIAK